MAETINLLDTFMKPRIYGNFSQRFINYQPDKVSKWIGKNLNGCERAQKMETELDLEWHPFIGADENVYLISNVTEFKLKVRGEVGFKNGSKALKWYASIYDSSRLHAEGMSLTRSYFDSLPEYLQKMKGVYWLDEQFDNRHLEAEYIPGTRIAYDYKKCDNCGLYSVHSGKMGKIELYDEIRGKSIYKRGMRIVIALPKDIKVVIGDSKRNGTTPNKALELLLRA